MLKVGILGGTFDPIHQGHIDIAHAAMRAADLDQVVFLPSGQPPHKTDSLKTDAVSRLNMTILSVYEQAGFSVSDMEVFREGVTYTVDTLVCLTKRQPDTSWYYIIGADTLFQIESWKNAGRLGEYLAAAIVAPRPGCDPDSLKRHGEEVSRRIGLKFIFSREAGPEISSTMIREKLAAGESVQGLLSRAAADYISAHGLYGAPWHQMSRQLRSSLSEHRFRHTLAVAETAVWLANRYQIDPSAAHLAGMLHDCAKGMDAPRLLQLIKSGGISADETEMSMPALLHAPAGAAMARLNYHVSDQAVLSAIRWHTTGRRNMTPLEKVVYLADMIEPGRADYPGLNEIRRRALEDLDEAVRLAAARSAAYVTERGKKLHPRTIELARECRTNQNGNGGRDA